MTEGPQGRCRSGPLGGPRELLHAGRVSDRHCPTERLLWIKTAFKLLPAELTGSPPSEASLHGDTKTAGPHVGVTASDVLARGLQRCHLQPPVKRRSDPDPGDLPGTALSGQCCLDAWCRTHACAHACTLTRRGCPGTFGGVQAVSPPQDESGVDRNSCRAWRRRELRPSPPNTGNLQEPARTYHNKIPHLKYFFFY